MKIKVPLYHTNLKIVVSKKHPNLKKYAAFVTVKKNTVIVFISPKCTPDVIAHEAVHVVNIIFKRVCIQLDIDNDEAQAYLTGWVVKQLTKAL